MEFQGYRRSDSTVGTRNLVLVIPSVGCSQGAAKTIAKGFRNVVYLPNILGCGQMAEDRGLVRKTLAGFGRNPNVFSVLVVGNGCEENAAPEVQKEIAFSGKRVEALVIQEVGGTRKTVAKGRELVREMLRDSSRVAREPVPLKELIVGTECGGSDFTSGLASNPAVGVASDMLVAEGATVILSETPELIGAEHLVAQRARTEEIKGKILEAVAWWENRVRACGQDIRKSNPAPGNIAGGITTLEEKSLGCIYKSGTGSIEEFLSYASRPSQKGLVYMDTPAHDIEQLTGMMAAGSQLALFTTGRGTPCGSPIGPVIKITANRDTYVAMRDNVDMDLSSVLRGRTTLKEAGKRIFAEILAVASGKLTKSEKLGQRDFAIFKMHPNV